MAKKVEHAVEISSQDLRDGTWEQQLLAGGDLTSVDALAVSLFQLLMFHQQLLPLLRFCMSRGLMLKCRCYQMEYDILQALLADKLQGEGASKKVAEFFSKQALEEIIEIF